MVKLVRHFGPGTTGLVYTMWMWRTSNYVDGATFALKPAYFLRSNGVLERWTIRFIWVVIDFIVDVYL